MDIIEGKSPNKLDDVYQHFGSAYFYQSEYLKNHMYINGGPPGGLGAPFNSSECTSSVLTSLYR